MLIFFGCIMKQKRIVGNWKMHGTLGHAKAFLDAVLPNLPEGPRVMLAVPYPLILPISERVSGTKLEIGAQNMHEEEEGAFTGEVSPLLLLDVGARFVIIGHSERRTLFHEKSPQIKKKVARALSAGLEPILCVGESLEEREAGLAESILEKQICAALEGVSVEDISKVTIAYEPIWAIGTGKSATPELAEEVHFFCRSLLERLYGKEIADLIPILYGGSVKPSNAASLFQKDNIDGALIGGASLDPESFLKIIQSS
jgi:triosephosphate isomerase (TIM)